VRDWCRRSKSSKKSFTRRRVHSEVVKREKCEVQMSPSPSPCPRYASEKNVEKGDEEISDAVRYKSTIKTEPVSKDQQMEELNLKDQEIQSKNAEIKIKDKEIQSLSEKMRLKDEELRFVRDGVQSKEREVLFKDNLIQSQCDEISKLKLELEKQVDEAHSMRADVELLKEVNEEKDKHLVNLKIKQESSTGDLARLEKEKKSLEAQVESLEQNVNQVSVEKIALEENVNQVTVEKELVEMKSSRLQRLNEHLRGELEKEKERVNDLDKLRSFLDSGRAEIAEMRQELRRMKENDFAKEKSRGHGSYADKDMELSKMKESLKNLKAENEKLVAPLAMAKNENATLRKDLHELQQVDHRLRWEVRRLNKELDNLMKKEKNNNVREESTACTAAGRLKNSRYQGAPVFGVAPYPAQINHLHHVS